MPRFCVQLLLVLALAASSVAPLAADSAAPVEKKTYRSASGELVLEVDPRWDKSYSALEPMLILRHRGAVVWRRSSGDFGSFKFPMHVLVADSGGYLVFGGYSAHNVGDYDEGLRFYDAAGRLIRFVSRRDLPPGQYSISTAHWFDEKRTVIKGRTLHFYTPGRAQPILFDIQTGKASPETAIAPGQGDDGVNRRKQWDRKMKRSHQKKWSSPNELGMS